LTEDELGLEHNAGDPAGFLRARGLL